MVKAQDDVIAQLDGTYLDVVDAYEYYADGGRATAAQEMADFVAAIRAHARARDPDFYIFPQNAPELATLVPAYLNSVDGIGQEDLYYGYNADEARFVGSLFWLEPGTNYNVRVTFADPDGGSLNGASVSATAFTRTEFDATNDPGRCDPVGSPP